MNRLLIAVFPMLAIVAVWALSHTRQLEVNANLNGYFHCHSSVSHGSVTLALLKESPYVDFLKIDLLRYEGEYDGRGTILCASAEDGGPLAETLLGTFRVDQGIYFGGIDFAGYAISFPIWLLALVILTWCYFFVYRRSGQRDCRS